MNWNAVAALAQVVGSLGVIVTTIYLAIQVRQNTTHLHDAARATQLSSNDRTVEAFSRYREYLTREDNAEIYARGMESYTDLSVVERIRFRAIIEEYFFAFHGAFERMSRGAYDNPAWISHAANAAAVIKVAGGRQ